MAKIYQWKDIGEGPELPDKELRTYRAPVQVRHKKTGLFTKVAVDPEEGILIRHKKSPGPWKGVKQVTRFLS